MKQLLCLLLAVILVCGAVSLESVLAVESETMQETEAQTGETVQEPETESVEVDSESEETEPAVGAETELLTNTEPDKYANRISGVLWIDASEDGIYDSTESPLADYPVYLYVEGDTDNAVDNAVDTATTGADGKYEFINITPGRYVVGIKAEENGTEYLLPMVGVQNDNKFYFAPDWSKVISNSVDVGADTVVEDIDAAMRTMPQIQPMANTTYTIDITTQATVTSSITTQSIPGVSIASNVLTFANTVDSTDTYILTGTTTTVRVVVATGVTANITLDGVNISNAVSPLQLQGTANTILTLSGTNTLRCTGAVTTASVIQAGVYVNRDATITIEGTGDLNAYAGFGSAGIGGIYTSASSPNGTVIINNGTVNATGGNAGAGIGGGYYGTGGTVIINGGTVYASSASGNYTGGAGIGGGGRGSGGTIIINSGNVTAVGSTCLAGHGGAGIGGGAASNTGTAGNGGIITINGGMVNATGSPTGSSAGIGGGTATSNATAGSSGTITISGGIVNATGGTSTFNSSSGPGIGAGENAAATSSGTITISGGTVTATAGKTTAPGIGSYSKTVNIGTVIFTGGSIYPTDSAGTVSVYPNPTNGSTYGAPDPVGILTITSLAGQEFSIMTAGSVATYTYKGTGHTAAAYPWLSYPGIITDAATAMSTTAASVTAPSTVNSAASSTATLNGTYYLNNTYPVTSAYFEWGTSTSYGTTIDMTSSVNISEITMAARSLSSPALTGLTPGVTYHYRLVIVTNGITVRGNDMTFTTPALAPSVDVIHDYPGGTTATLEGIYDLNSGTFVSGEFEISDDGGSTWSTPTGGTLTGSTATPSVTLTGLTPGTTYHYRLTVTNSEGATTTVMQELTVSAKTVTISNEVTGAYANMDKSFTYTVYFEDSAGAPLTSGTQFTYTGGVIAGSGATAPSGGTLTLGSGGEATVTLTTGQTITIAGVATSAKVRVVQTTDANYTTSFKDSLDASSTSGADTGVRSMTAADRTFDYTNTRSVVPGGISTGSGGIVLLSLMALALASGLAITAAYRRRTGAR